MDDSGSLSFNSWEGYSFASRNILKYQVTGAETVFRPQIWHLHCWAGFIEFDIIQIPIRLNARSSPLRPE